MECKQFLRLGIPSALEENPSWIEACQAQAFICAQACPFAPQLVLDYITAENDLCQDSWLRAVTSAINWLIPREKPAPRDPDDEAPPSLLRPDSEVVIAWLAHHQSSGATSLRRAIARYLQEEHMMEMVHAGHKKLLDLCAEFVELVPMPDNAGRDLSGLAHFPCNFCPRVFSSVQARQAHHWKFHGHFSVERKFVFGSTCIACGQCYWTAQRMQQHLRYSRRYGASGCLAQLQQFFEPLSAPTPIEIPETLQHYHRLPRCLILLDLIVGLTIHYGSEKFTSSS